ncbi:hypothetical protein DFP92_12523 [Yoonia sediminilitoris]|uniref:Uncharacterized protein n=1 Tax=Yoonia sediminilitoris TaxID=1286148 RepID=A0A2T6K5C0_9RHOB|nr:hypothetical protein C8N45_12523 [Yoonia sediminilitoris]RCW89582.1 hypothetical protein DFP92_12523 [Yoonia sediminilitoris]
MRPFKSTTKRKTKTALSLQGDQNFQVADNADLYSEPRGFS